MTILAVEDALIAEIKAALGTKVRGVESLPGDWDDDMLRRLLRAVPGAFVAFAGGARRAGYADGSVDSRWIVYVCTGHASGEAARRRGDAQQAGAYELMQVLVPRLNGFVVPDVGACTLQNLNNLYTGTVDRTGVAIYAIELSLPMAFDLVPAADLLAPFETFDGQYDLQPHEPFAEHRKWLDGTPTDTAADAHDTVALPQV